jgi:hypothetical protein
MTAIDERAAEPRYTAELVAALLNDMSEIRLFTAEQASEFLNLPVSWLEKRGAARSIPCTYEGKYLRFSTQNLRDLIADGNVNPATRGRRRG